MKLKTARNWLGIYFLLTASIVGAFFLMAANSPFLPLEPSEAEGVFQIVVPVLVGQVAVIFQWMAVATPQTMSADTELPLPTWAVVLPPMLTLAIVFCGVVTLVMSNQPNSHLHVSPATFRTIVTFALSILNASTVVLVGRIFPARHHRASGH